MCSSDLSAVILRAACAAPAAAALIDRIDALFGLDPQLCLCYQDARRGISKRVMVRDGQVAGVRLTGETAARDWLKDAMSQGTAAETLRKWMLAPLVAPPAGTQGRGRILCNCMDVAQTQIEAEVARGCGLAELQQKLGCGTQCGSCLPEIKRMTRIAEAA